MNWNRPEAFLLFLALGPLVYLWTRKRSYLLYSTLKSFEGDGLAEASFLKRNLSKIITLVACSFIILALANPVIPFKERTVVQEGKRYVLALDMSGSMSGPGENSPGERCKEAAIAFTGTLPESDEVSCVFFDTSALTDPLVLTRDKNAVRLRIKNRKVYELGGGTHFSTPLHSASRLLILQKMQEAYSFEEANERTDRLLNKLLEVDKKSLTEEEEQFVKQFKKGNVIIMITDGLPAKEDVPTTVDVIEKILLRLGIRYYLCSLEAMPEELPALITASGGKQFVDPDYRKWKDILVKDIAKLERMRFGSIELIRNYSLFRYFALIAISLIFAEYLLRFRFRVYN